MTDYEEDQLNEIEAIESIYPEEFTSISKKKPFSFKIYLETTKEKTDDHPEITVSIDITFTLIGNYPDEAPLVEVKGIEGITGEQIQEIEEQLSKEAEDNLGMVMAFTLVSSMQEKLEEIAENIKKEILDDKKRRQKEEEERENRKFTGTPVTTDNFLVWRDEFNAVVAERRKQTQNPVLIPKSKLTGRQLFEQDDKLFLSDADFIDSTDVDVEVDETLFQDLEDLDLEDEELED